MEKNKTGIIFLILNSQPILQTLLSSVTTINILVNQDFHHKHSIKTRSVFNLTHLQGNLNFQTIYTLYRFLNEENLMTSSNVQ